MKINNLNNKLELLSKISNLLEQKKDLKEKIKQILKMLSEFTIMKRITLTILNREKDEIFIKEAYGLSDEQQIKGKYKLGEGITGKVVQTGNPIIVPNIIEEETFLNRTKSRSNNENISFICIPIKYDNLVIGTLNADRENNDTEMEDDFNILFIIAFMISEAVSIYRLEQEKKHEYILKLKEENTILKEKLKNKFHPSNIIGRSKAIQEVFDLISKISNTNTTVILLGESGVGKELVANAIHYNSIRSNKPFIKFNCAALPETLIESELFGHEKGAFTGAVSSRKGKFEYAEGGSIFLDEISEIPLNIQAKLLRILQEKEITPLGSEKTKHIDITIIAATNKDLMQLVEENKFRKDLFYRLYVYPIVIPPLRKRKTDIPLLIDFFIEKYSKEFNIHVTRISTPAIDMLIQYHWPGNIRELQNCIERAVLLSTDGVIRSYHLPPTIQTAGESGTSHTGSLKENLDNIEKELIIEALKETKGNMAEAAKKLDITERIMGLRVKKHDLEIKTFKKINN